MSIEEFIISVFCLIDDLYQQEITRPLRTRERKPKLSDSEVITMEIVGERGTPVQLSLTTANIDELEAAYEIINDIQGVVIGDKGLIRPILKEECLEGNIKLDTPLQRNMKDNRPRSVVNFLMNVGQRIETNIGPLVQYFDIEKINCRYLWHLTSRMSRKMFGLTIGAFFNIQAGKEVMQFENMIM